MGMFAVVSGFLQPLQLRLRVHTKVMFPRSSLLLCVLREAFFLKQKMKFCGIIMVIRDDICSKIHSSLI